MMRHELKFQEVGVEMYSFSAKFASQCTMDGINYPQGTGKTKKEAKTNAAKSAFSIVLGLNQEEMEADGRWLVNKCFKHHISGIDIKNKINVVLRETSMAKLACPG